LLLPIDRRTVTADDNHKEMRVKAVQGLGTCDQGWTWLFAPHVAPRPGHHTSRV